MSPLDSTEPPLPKHKLRVPRARRGDLTLFVGTRKGLFRIEGDARRETFGDPEPALLGYTVFHAVSDPRDRSIVLAAVCDPSGRPAVMVSGDGGRTFEASEQPPRFSAESPFEDPDPSAPGSPDLWLREVAQVFWLTPADAFRPRTWFAGTSPQGLFRSDDGGRTWAPVEGLNRDPRFDEWTAPGEDRTPDGAKLHSVLFDPRDTAHMFLGMSSGGILESKDEGETWERLDGGLGAHIARDPHALVMAPTNPDRLWMQSHFGVFRMDLEERIWRHVGEGVGDDRMDEVEILDAGFPIAVHPADPDMAFTVPMDGTDLWTRMPKDGRATVAKTVDGGRSWTHFDGGLPKGGAWWTVKRQCLAVDGYDPLGVYFGTSSGEVWASRDEGEHWSSAVRGLPHIYSVEIG